MFRASVAKWMVLLAIAGCGNVQTGGPADGGTGDGGGATCESSVDCTDPTAPVCEHDCRGCQTNVECEGIDTATPLCASNGSCAECLDNTSCTDPQAPLCSPGGACGQCSSSADCTAIDPTLTFCSDGGECLACEPDALLRCEADQAVFCASDGSGERTEACSLGCHDTTRCNDLAPSNNLSSFLDMTDAAADVALTDGAKIDTDSGNVTNGDGSAVSILSQLVAAPSGGVAVRVLVVGSLTIGNTTVNGNAGLAILSAGTVEIRGALEMNSAGVFHASSACAGKIGDFDDAAPAYAGDGGGAFGTAGAAGGSVVGANGAGTQKGGLAGSASGNSTLTPLRGGCRGGGNRGDGGGALQIVSRTEIRFALGTSPGHINASGFGGGQRLTTSGLPYAGEGGGAGGAILLEAPVVTVPNGTGFVANGGGGGCAQANGEDGKFSASAAVGAKCSASNRTDGGNGGAIGSSPQDGGSLTTVVTSPGGGGGGGAVGRIRINTADGSFSPGASSIISPAPTVGTIGVR